MNTFLQHRPKLVGLEVHFDGILGLVLTLKFEERHLLCIGVQDLKVYADPLQFPCQPLLTVEDISGQQGENLRYAVQDVEEGFLRFFCQNLEWVTAGPA